jgi:hypothetical protein
MPKSRGFTGPLAAVALCAGLWAQSADAGCNAKDLDVIEIGKVAQDVGDSAANLRALQVAASDRGPEFGVLAVATQIADRTSVSHESGRA